MRDPKLTSTMFTRTSTRFALVLSALLLGLLTGCGESDEDKVRSVVDTYNKALVASEWDKACQLVSHEAPAYVADFMQENSRYDDLDGNLPTSYSEGACSLDKWVALGDLDDPAKYLDYEIQEIKVSDNSANVWYEPWEGIDDPGIEERQPDATLIGDDGNWKLLFSHALLDTLIYHAEKDDSW